MTTDGSPPQRDKPERDRRKDDDSSTHRFARGGALLGPVFFALVGGVLIILAIVFI